MYHSGTAAQWHCWAFAGNPWSSTLLFQHPTHLVSHWLLHLFYSSPFLKLLLSAKHLFRSWAGKASVNDGQNCVSCESICKWERRRSGPRKESLGEVDYWQVPTTSSEGLWKEMWVHTWFWNWVQMKDQGRDTCSTFIPSKKSDWVIKLISIWSNIPRTETPEYRGGSLGPWTDGLALGSLT